MFKIKIPFVLLLAAVASPAHGQLVVKSGEDVNFNLGFQGQFWLDSTQVPATGAYPDSLYIRRIRLLVGGSMFNDLTFFFETDDPNLGKMAAGTKTLTSGFIVQDAFLEYKISNAFRLDGGLMLVPFSRNTMQSTLSYYTLDISPITTVSNIVTDSSGLRDVGFQARGFFCDDHLTYRVGLFSGERIGVGNNSLRTAGYLQYDFFDREKNYTFVGTALGKQKILAIDTGFDTQGSYRSYSGNIASDTPVRGGDEIGGQLQYIHYDGRTTFLTIPKQNDYLAELAYYSRLIKLQPFFKFENESLAIDQAKDYNKWGGGLNYYIHNQNLKFTAQVQRVLPQNSPTKPSSEFTLQMQVFYF